MASTKSKPTFHVAGFWRRIIGAAADTTIIVLTTALAWSIVSLTTSLSFPESSSSGIDYWLDVALVVHPALLGVAILPAVVATTYALLFHIILGKTPGMMLARVRIIDMYGEPPNVSRSLARTLGYVACIATLGLGFIWAGFDHEKRGLHDWLSGTYVVKR